MAEVFVTNVVAYNLSGSTNLILPKAGTNLYGIDTVRFVGQKLWQTLPKHWRSSKEVLRPYLFIAAANYAKVYCKFRIFISIFCRTFFIVGFN